MSARTPGVLVRPAPAAVVGLALAVPRAASACAVCTGNDPAATQTAFLLGTALLSLLPLAMIGGLAFWLWRRARRGERRDRPLPHGDALRTSSGR